MIFLFIRKIANLLFKVELKSKIFKVWSGLWRVIGKHLFLQILGACHKNYKMQKRQFLIVYSAFSAKTFIF